MSDGVVPALNLIWSAVVRLVQGYETGKQEFFTNHIDPLHQRMLAIHRDYVAGFEEAKRCIEGNQRPTEAVIEFLKQRRRNLAAERDLARVLSQELGAADRRLVGDDAWGGLKMYSEAVVKYFSASSIGSLSWYSEFIDSVESRRRLGYIEDSTVWNPGGFRAETKTELLTWINIALDRELPAALTPINKYYAFLRTRLL